MLAPLRSDIDLQPLFKKLGHDVEEIRVRSLRNIVSKLSHGLVCDADLVQERHLLVRLLEWFNFPTVPCQEDVFKLIQRLAKHGSSAEILVELGAVNFLSQLRPDCDDDLHMLIDGIVELLLSLPSQDASLLLHKKECVYQHQHQVQTGNVSRPNDVKHQELLQGASMTSHRPDQGYFALQDTGINPAQPDKPMPSNQGVRGLKFCTFPWLSLTHTDRHVLLSTNSLLCSSRPNLVATSCEFISDVVLQDFPAEIFLQRPSIVKSLHSLLGVKPLGDTDSEIPVGAARCLKDMAVLIMARYRFYHDPSLYCPKQDFGSVPSSSYTSVSGRASQATSQSTLSSNSRPSVIGRNEPRLRGDGQDPDSPSSMGTSQVMLDSAMAAESDTDSEDALSLQFSQLTLPQFTVETLTKILPVLKTTNPEVTLAAAQLLQEVIQLVQVSMTTDLWEDKSVAGRNLTEKLSDSLESLGEALEFHHEHCCREGISSLAIRHHRMAFIVLVAFTLQILQAMVPVNKASDILPGSLVSAITLVVMDQCLIYCMPQARHMFGVYLEKLDCEKYQLYQDARLLCKSLESSSAFLAGSQSVIQEDLLQLASSSVSSLPYHPDLTVIEEFVKVYSELCRNTKKDSENVARAEGRKTLLKLLAHPRLDIRQRTYKECFGLVKNCVNVDEAAKAHSTASVGVLFMADAGVLYEMSCFGLSDSDKQVCTTAGDIILHLVQGKLLMQSQVWQATIQAIIPSLPVLQCHAGRETTLSRCILGLYEAPLVSSAESSNFHILPPPEKFRGALRLLFRKDEDVRHDAARTVLWFLTQDPDRSKKLPSVSNPVLTDLAGLYLMEYPVVLDDSRERSVFQVDGLVKVYNIYISKDTETSLKKSAAEQIAIMLQDATLHKAFISGDGVEKTLSYLEEAIDATSRKQVAMVTLIPACLSILRYIVHEDASIRHQLAHQANIYYVILRSTLLCQSDSRIRYQGAHLMVLLLFDEVASLSSFTQDDTCPRFALPHCVIQRYQLPFRCPVSQTASIHRVDRLPDPDPALEPLPLRMLRTAWNVARHEGIDGLIAHLDENPVKPDQKDKHNGLQLNKTDQLVIVQSHIQHSLSRSLTGITQAGSHHEVKMSVWHLSLWLTTGLLLASDELDITVSPAGQFLLLEWKDVLRRFVEVVPANSDDKLLLSEVLRFLTNLMQVLKFVPADLLDWLGDISCGNKSVLMTLLSQYAANHQTASQGVEDGSGRQQGRKTEDELSPHRVLHKQLLTFFCTFVRCLPLRDAWRHKGRYLGGSLTHGLLTSLNMTDALPFYDLPPLEGTLHCLVHVTARSGWSLDWNEGDSLSLCKHLLNSLVEVVSAFHVGRGGTAMSYMGKGVTKSATLCLQHLTNEMSARALDQEWSSQWFHTRQGKSLDWLMALWSYRDPEVRAAGLCIAASLTSTEEGCVTIAIGCQHLPAGLWGVAFGMLMDQSECSMVREQAANLLCNLLSRRFPDLDTGLPTNQIRWAGPQVHDEQTQVSLSGQPALLALLHHYHFYHGVANMLQHYYGQSTIQPVSVVEESTISSSVTPSGPSTVTTPGSSHSHGSSASTPTMPQHTWLNDNVSDIHHPSVAFPSPLHVNAQQASPDTRQGRPVPTFQGNGTEADDLISPTPSAPSPTHGTGRFSSVVTPCLVSAVCRVLRNLLVHVQHDVILGITKDDILTSLLRLFNGPHLLELFRQYHAQSPTSRNLILELQLVKYLGTCCEILKLTKACLLQGQLANLGAKDDNVVTNCLQLLQLRSLDSSDCDVWLSVSDVWTGIFDLLMVHLHVGGNTVWQKVRPLFVSHWKIVADCIIHTLKNIFPSSTRIAALQFLNLVLSKATDSTTAAGKGVRAQRGGKEVTARSTMQPYKEEMETTLGEVLDVKSNPQGDNGGHYYGSSLCQVLLQAYDGLLPRSSIPLNAEKPSIVSALKSLLASSRQAQLAALEGGLVESVVDRMKDTHAKLAMESLHVNKAGKKKENPLLCELSDQIQLLDNCMYGNTDVKIAAYQAGLTTVIHKLWAWCATDRKLLARVLLMLATYIARCPTACSSLANSPPGQTGGSLLHSLVRQSQREKSRMDSTKAEDHIVAERLFAVLGNAVWSSECRNVLWKSGFLQGFSHLLSPKKRKVSACTRQSATLWLQLLANLTFTMEGQQMVMKIPDCLELLMEHGQCSNTNLQYLAVVILHNLCFLNANKMKLLATDNLVSFFMERLQCNSLDIQLAVLNALWVVVQGSQKAKAVLKGTNLLQRLLSLDGQLRKDLCLSTEGSPRVSKCQQIISNLQLLISD